MKHLISTRIKFDDDTLLMKYLEVSKKIFLPSILSQTNKNFILCVIANRQHHTLIDNIINTNAHDKILNIVKDYDKDILVISDSNKLKEKIKLKYPVINIFKNKIKHIGEGVANNDDTYISLLVDLLFISLSKEVLGLSTLHHGSGFSEWVSRINNLTKVE